jgi:hypothetical protein
LTPARRCPCAQDYTVRARVSAAIIGSQSALGNYYQSNQKIPDSLDIAGIPSQLADGTQLKLDSRQMVLTVITKQGELVFKPTADARSHQLGLYER